MTGRNVTTGRDVALVADIGATNARFALVVDGSLEDPRTLPCADHDTFEDAAAAYLRDRGLRDRGSSPRDPRRPVRAAIAAAGPLVGDAIEMTNHPWHLEGARIRSALALEDVRLVNDFVAQSLSVPHLAAQDVVPVGGEHGNGLDGPVAVIGPGTGLGVGAILPAGQGWVPIAGEGGHVSLSAHDELEQAILSQLRAIHGHVSAERVISGSGLLNIYRAIAAIDGADPRHGTPAEVGIAALDGDRTAERAALAMFAFLGAVAGDLALTVGARGGVYIAGGVTPRLRSILDRSAFRERFEAKGRLQPFLAQIPTRLIVHELPAFVGLSSLLETEADRPSQPARRAA